MAELAGVVTETVAEVAESVAADALNVAEISRSLIMRDLSIGFVLGSSATGLLSFLLLRRKLEKKYVRLAEDEIATMREHFKTRQRVTEMREYAQVVEEKPELERIVEERGYVPPPPGGLNVAPRPGATWDDIKDILENPVDALNDRDVADRVVGDWDYPAELAKRSPDRPYVIHENEFREQGYTSVSLTYYGGDDVLCDDANVPVDNKDRLVGDDNLAKFGHGSGSPYVVYVRNDVLSIDMEISLQTGNFVDQIQGLTHSDRRPRRIRFDDET